jgi:glutathione S-transferase
MSLSPAKLTLIIGTRNLSSWSLRPWLALKHTGLDFDTVELPLDTPEYYQRIELYSPTRRVPVLLHGDRRIWDSLAICEYANELTAAKGWPPDPAARAWARSISAEMHSGFQALRSCWPMNASGRHLNVAATAETLSDITRIDAIWNEARAAHADQGPWLFGSYSIADAMYAPVVLRFNSYDAKVSTVAQQYMATTLGDPLLKEWTNTKVV